MSGMEREGRSDESRGSEIGDGVKLGEKGEGETEDVGGGERGGGMCGGSST